MKTYEIKYEESIIDQNLLQNVDIAFKNLKKAIYAIAKKLNQKYNKRVKFNLELIFERAVDQFYESYSPNIYDRQESLYTAKKITVNDDTWEAETSSEYLRGSWAVDDPNYIYVNSFEYGFHGGAIDGEDHPEPGVPWWKFHGEWYKPATQGPAPEETIDDQFQTYIDEQRQLQIQEFKSLLKPYVDDLKKQIAACYGKR